MSTSSEREVSVPTSDSDRYELYRVLDIRQKLTDGQAYIEEIRVMSRPPPGIFPPGTRSRIVRIRLTVNDYTICLAHQYVSATGADVTGPDPKWIAIDDVIFKQGESTP